LDSEWNSQPENIIAGPQETIRPRPNPPLPGIPAGPPPVLPIGILNAAEMKMANLQLNCHNAAINREKEQNLLCTKYAAIMQYVVSALLSRALTIDKEAHSILIRNRITNLPDRNGISLCQVLENLWDHYGIADEKAKSKWESIFDIPRETNEPIMNFLSRWSTSIKRLNNAQRPCTNHFLISKFKSATKHDPRVKSVITKLQYQSPRGQTWEQPLHLAREQEPNLDGNLDDMQQASTPISITNSKPFCPPLSSSPMRPKESALTVNKTSDDAAVGNTVPIVLSKGTDSLKGAALEKHCRSGSTTATTAAAVSGGQLNPQRISQEEWEGNLGAAREYNLQRYQSSCGIADHATCLTNTLKTELTAKVDTRAQTADNPTATV